MDYLPVWSSPHQVSLRHANPLLLDPIYLLVQELLGLLHGFLKLVFLDLTRAGGNRVGEWSLYGCGEHVCYVQLRVGAVGHIRGGGEGQTSLLGAVGGQQDLRRKYAHRGNLLTLGSFLEPHDAISRSYLHFYPMSRASAAGQPFSQCVHRTLLQVSPLTLVTRTNVEVQKAHRARLRRVGSYLPDRFQQGFADPTFLSQILFSALHCVAPYCVRGGVRVVSGAALESAFYKGAALRVRLWPRTL